MALDRTSGTVGLLFASIGMISVRQLSSRSSACSSVLCGSSSWTWGCTGRLSPLSIAGPLLIISFSDLRGLAPVGKFIAWACLLTLFGSSATGIAYASTIEVETKVHGEGILLIENDALFFLQAHSAGKLGATTVKQGDQVVPGEVVGRIPQPDLERSLRAAERGSPISGERIKNSPNLRIGTR